MDGKEFLSHAPGYWSREGGIPAELWNDWKWQLKNRVTSLAQLEQHLELSNEERSAGGKSAICSGVRIFDTSVIASIIASNAAWRAGRILATASSKLNTKSG